MGALDDVTARESARAVELLALVHAARLRDSIVVRLDEVAAELRVAAAAAWRVGEPLAEAAVRAALASLVEDAVGKVA